jgi:transcription elongation factor GreA
MQVQELTNKIPITPTGYSALEKELRRRVQIDRVRLADRLQQAIADDCNLAENSEYHAAQSEQQLNEVRIAELEEKLARAEVIDVSKLSGDIIKFGATVTLTDEDSGDRKVFQIVGEPEADVHSGRISVASPIARALIGKTAGATARVHAPGGIKAYRILQVNWRANCPGESGES